MSKPLPIPRTSRWQELHQRWRFALVAILLALIGVAGWFSDELGGLFAHKPSAGEIAGAWRFDQDGYAQIIAEAVAGIPAAEQDSYRGPMLGAAAAFRDRVYTFDAEGYSLTTGERTERVTCTYASVPSNLLVLQPVGRGAALTLILERSRDRVHISVPGAAIPLMRVP